MPHSILYVCQLFIIKMAPLSTYCFILGFLSCFALLFTNSLILFISLFLILVIFNTYLLKNQLNGERYDVGVRALLLGSTFGLGVAIIKFSSYTVQPFGWYLAIVSFFHFSEFVSIALSNPQTLSISSFVLTNGWEYYIAAISCCIEFFIECYFIPTIKTWRLVSLSGLFLCIGGEFVRKLAMWTASTNFTHLVQNEKRKGHELITHGIYSYMRHPSYMGWLTWSIGTQLVLVNPLCTVLYAVISWRFFYKRVEYEEITLLNFFGKKYQHYQRRTPTGLPFIKGFGRDKSINTVTPRTISV